MTNQALLRIAHDLVFFYHKKMDKRDLANVDRSAQRLNLVAASNFSLTENISVQSRLVYKHQVLELSIALSTFEVWVQTFLPTGVLSIHSSGVTYAQKPGFYRMSIADKFQGARSIDIH